VGRVGQPQRATADDAYTLALQMSYFWGAHLKQAPNFPKGAQALLDKIFVADPASRATLAQIKEDAWFQGECLTDAELTGLVNARKSKVEEVLAKQKAEKEAKKQKKKSRRRRRRNGEEEFDAFEGDAYRGIGDDEEEEEAEEAKEDAATVAEGAESTFGLTKFFYAQLAAPPEEIMKQAHEDADEAA